MTVTPIKPLVLAYVQPQGESPGAGTGARAALPAPARRAVEAADTLQISDAARQKASPQEQPAKQLPAFGRFQLGGPEPLPFGPSQYANALTRIPGDGLQARPEGVQLGHQPARGLNILA